MTFPQMIEYNDAVQDPRAFTDLELKAGKVATTPLGLPLALSGGFALTYTLQTPQKKIAVRCFHKEVPDAQRRYAKISEKLRTLGSRYFVNFDFQPQGIRIRGAEYPIVKMDWAEGETLGIHLDRVSSNPSHLTSLRQSFFDLSECLERNGVAHGDIQNENVIISNGGPRLIDYDGMFVPGLIEGQGAEIGNKHFQHPQRDATLFGPKMDRFSFIVLDVSLEALAVDPALHRRFREGGNAIIFNANDFAAPATSEIFSILAGIPTLRDSAKKLSAICGAPISNVPTLADFRAGRNIPISVARPVATPAKPSPSPTYIGAFQVLDAKEFRTVLQHVGDKVELVGQIVSVKNGTGKRGRGKGLPYVFINFGPWNKESVKIAIWSEGLGNLSERPSEAWVGKWISVTGLIDPPFSGNHYGRPYQNVGIAVDSDNQIIRITESEAKFRMGRGGGARPTKAAPVGKPKNADILKDLKGTVRTPSTPSPVSPRSPVPPPSSPTKSLSRNEQILQTIKPTITGTQQSSPPGYSPPRYSPPQSPGLLTRVPGAVWGWLAFFVFMALVRLSK